MRVLFTAYAEKTHFLGMVPLAWALRNAGHEVRVASQPELTEVITGAGLTAVPVGKDHILHRLVGRTNDLPATAPRAPSYDLAEDRPEVLTWEYLKNGYGGQFVPWWARVVNDPMIGELTAFCRHWKPDLVIWEPVTYAGAIAAKACGAAHARMLWSLDLFTRMRGHYLRAREQHAPHERDAMAEWLGARATKAGTTFSEEMTSGHFTIDPTPTSLRLPSPHTYLPVRYIPYNGTAVIPPGYTPHPPNPASASPWAPPPPNASTATPSASRTSSPTSPTSTSTSSPPSPTNNRPNSTTSPTTPAWSPSSPCTPSPPPAPP